MTEDGKAPRGELTSALDAVPPRGGERKNSDFNIQVACVTLAKGTHRQQLAGTERKQLALREKGSYAKNVKSHMFNTIVCFNADAGKLVGAENWMLKLDSQQGISAEVRTLNNLLLSSAKAGEHDKAEEWFTRCGTPALHPELAGLTPTTESYNIMINMFTKAGEIQKAEKWFLTIEREMQVRPTLASQLGLIKACLRLKEVRRAHQWATYLITNGCEQNPHYEPKFVKDERVKFRSAWQWDVAGFIETILSVVDALTELQNAFTAHEWLRYLVGCGVKPEEAYSTWEKVRRVHPKEIISTILSGEQADPCSPGLPPRTKLASMFGEGAKRGSSLKMNPDRPMSQASASPRSMSNMSGKLTPRVARTSLCDTGRRSGAASPSLRKFLDARHRGATPSLAWASGRAKTEMKALGPPEDGYPDDQLDGNTSPDGPRDAPTNSLPDGLPPIQQDTP